MAAEKRENARKTEILRAFGGRLMRRSHAPKPGALPDELHLEDEKNYEIVVLTELVKIVVKPLLRG